jgi:TRAP-type C4-dicarboxylate transport system substrate-binding protein
MVRTLRFAIAALALVSSGAAVAQEVVLRAVTAFQEGTAFSRPFEDFIKKVNEDGKGLVRINFIGGPRAMPPTEVGNAVRGGVVDIGNVTSAFYTNLLPEAQALQLSTRSMEELRKNGGWELLNRLHNEKVNAHYLARHGDGIPFYLYLTREIGEPDLKGLTVRVTPVYRAFFTRLGANLVNTPPGEVYTALERGIVQGYGWPAVGVFDLGWQERTKFRVEPGFYTVDVNILVNLPKWNSLTDKQKEVLTNAALWVEERQRTGNAAFVKEELARQEQAGIKPIVLTGERKAMYEKTAREAGWADVEKAAPHNYPELRRLLASD